MADSSVALGASLFHMPDNHRKCHMMSDHRPLGAIKKSTTKTTTSTFKIDHFYISQLDLSDPSKLGQIDWAGAICGRGLGLPAGRRPAASGQLEMRITRRTVEILEVKPAPGSQRQSAGGRAVRSRSRQSLHRHNLADIVCYGAAGEHSNRVGYVRQVKAHLYELVAIIAASTVDKRRIFDALKVADTKEGEWRQLTADNKENLIAISPANSSAQSAGAGDGAACTPEPDADEVDVIKVLPPISQREHPVFEIADDEDG
jgi:hypothetical protein